MSRKIVMLAVAAATLATLVGLALPAQAQSGGGCQLAGTAYFKPGLNNNQQDFLYNFTGKLTSCQASPGITPHPGVVSAGRTLVFKHEKFQEPVPSGNGSCGEGTTAGIAFAKWANGTYTIIKYSTQSATGAVLLQGSVLGSYKLRAIHPKPGQPRSHTVRTTAYKGDNALGLLTFSPNPDPTACNTGVRSAGINGFTGIGSQ